jgi:hypothetical protein
MTSAVTRARKLVPADTGSREATVSVRSGVVVQVLLGPSVAEPDGCHDGDCGGRVRGAPLDRGGESRRGLGQRASRSGFVDA